MSPGLNEKLAASSAPSIRPEASVRVVRPLLRGASGSFRRALTADAVFRRVCASFALALLALLGLIVFEIAYGSRLAVVRFGPRFIVQSVWDPVLDRFG